MTGAPPSPDDSDIPTDLAERLSKQDSPTLRRTLGYIRGLLQHRDEHHLDEIGAGPGEEIVSVTRHDGYAEVVKRHTCEQGCPDCPHEPYLYHVRVEELPDGDSHLHWTLIGPVSE